MSFWRSPKINGWDLRRFATSCIVPGGFTKSIKFFRQHHKGDIESFSDHGVSDGKLYEMNGFENVGEIPPDYKYVVDGSRVHKFGYRIKRFREDPSLKYEEGLSEKALADLNNIPRIWDAGKTKWILRDNPSD